MLVEVALSVGLWRKAHIPTSKAGHRPNRFQCRQGGGGGRLGWWQCAWPHARLARLEGCVPVSFDGGTKQKIRSPGWMAEEQMVHVIS